MYMFRLYEGTSHRRSAMSERKYAYLGDNLRVWQGFLLEKTQCFLYVYRTEWGYTLSLIPFKEKSTFNWLGYTPFDVFNQQTQIRNLPKIPTYDSTISSEIFSFTYVNEKMQIFSYFFLNFRDKLLHAEERHIFVYVFL